VTGGFGAAPAPGPTGRLFTIGVADRTGGGGEPVRGRATSFGMAVGGAVGRFPPSLVDGAIGRTAPGVVGLAVGGGGGGVAGAPGFDGLRDGAAGVPAAGRVVPAAAVRPDDVAGRATDEFEGSVGFAGGAIGFPATGRDFGDPPPTAGGTAVIAGGRGGAIGLGGGTGAGVGVSCT